MPDKDIGTLCSGQVITDLRSAVKEVLENALDAKATNVEIRLFEDGLDGFEVRDNGVGIQDYTHVCEKRFTSKINSFQDVQKVSTFGFRGEALSSLCEVRMHK